MLEIAQNTRAVRLHRERLSNSSRVRSTGAQLLNGLPDECEVLGVVAAVAADRCETLQHASTQQRVDVFQAQRAFHPRARFLSQAAVEPVTRYRKCEVDAGLRAG